MNDFSLHYPSPTRQAAEDACRRLDAMGAGLRTAARRQPPAGSLSAISRKTQRRAVGCRAVLQRHQKPSNEVR